VRFVLAQGVTVFSFSTPLLQLPISERTMQGLQKGSYESMKDIQTACIPHLLAGRDLMGAAKTGSGKTLAFLVPALEKLYRMGWNSLDGEASFSSPQLIRVKVAGVSSIAAPGDALSCVAIAPLGSSLSTPTRTSPPCGSNNSGTAARH
jgi:hypothetical protein